MHRRDLAHVDEAHPVHRARAVLLERGGVRGGDVALVRLEVVDRVVPCSSVMIRSRVTLASTEAAAMQAATRSPFQTASPGTSRPSTGKPSVSTYDGRTSSRASERRSASMLATCMPSRSHSSGGTTTTDQAVARFSDLVVAALARPGGEQLGVGQPGHLPAPALGEDRGGGDERTGARARGRPRRRRRRLQAGPAQRPLVAVEPGVAPDGQTPGQHTHDVSIVGTPGVARLGWAARDGGRVSGPSRRWPAGAAAGRGRAARPRRTPCRRRRRPGTWPPPGSPRCTRESAELERLSPCTQR